MIFYVVFLQFLFDFCLQVGVWICRDSRKIGLLRHPGASWRYYFDFLLLLASFWAAFGSILGGFGDNFSPISANSWIIFLIFGVRFPRFFDTWLHCFLYLVRVTPRPVTNKGWPGGLREAIQLIMKTPGSHVAYHSPPRTP